MDTKLLMIGDLIMCHNSIFFVTSVDGYGSLIGIDNERDADLVHIDELTPIPLTAEILEKNGFTFRTPTSMHYDYLFVVFLNEDAEVFTLIGGQQRWLRYVHELQHALRLCGLTDIADNFQV